ncbi:hypothetical protein Noc_0745 [Nitrosococcus oceani ATCC 19707]|uniref:Sulfotransferase family protein n=2 Tax=Nitrosococcus oceani TaxID=1229 RepID=Q3JD38_NITOC|nr:sulfotransferase family 2 domain-containing protein [Nitrosococcus oceani]ABA57258.1 hypothetical protein Noc_0745 [Nitrosococcus oceani ATCC 19707]EDZ65365.1 hypothetical protein NOC27_2045 [Nitrosococcus oceani AFC27]KFI20232.1 hypothetical protein IB75_03745 [Nitrosococcus oceani C-27]GEM20130.1 hypothetical protein NONS58_15370 [Nitrosococcus oceani]
MPTTAPKLHFLHIPKTAGTSVTQFLQRQYDLDQIVFETTWRELFEYQPRMPKLKLFRGHFGINLSQMIGPEFKVITFLREPVSRVISQYYHVRKRATEGLNQFAGEMELAEFMHHKQGRKLCRNLQTRYIGRSLEVGQLWAHPAVLNIPPDRFFDDLASPLLLEQAKQNLNGFFFVGLTEYYDISMLLLCHKLAALPELDAVKRRERERDAKRVPTEVLQHLEAENQLDMELYRHGKTLLVHDLASEFNLPEIASMPVEAALDYVNERKSNLSEACLSRYGRRMRAEQQENWEWDVSMAFQGTGWSDAHGRLGETPHRWSGPKLISTVDAPVDPRRDYEITIHILRFMTGRNQRQLEVHTSSGPISLKGRKMGSGWVGQGIVNGQSTEDPFLRLSFHVPETVSVAELGGDPNDTDKRGFALRAIILNPIPASQKR